MTRAITRISVKRDPQASFKSIVFCRSNTTPSTPTGGSFSNPVPAGWNDGVPSGTSQIWMTTRVFTSDGMVPQQTTWTTPQPVSDTADIDFEFSAVAANPKTPTTAPTYWHNTATEYDIWMAVRKCKNGSWGSWKVSKIKGEDGQDAHSPYVGDNGNWFFYDDAQGKYVDSGRTAQGDDGHSPYIGTNGNWWEWDAGLGRYTDTDIKAKGEDGEPGSPGGRGPAGPIRRISEWSANTKYYQGGDGEPYEDVVIYNGVYYQCSTTHTSTSVTPLSSVNSGGRLWILATQYKFVATKGVFIGTDSNGWIADAGVLRHTSGKVALNADGSISTSNGDFVVDPDGNFTSKNGTIEGTIHAKKGSIGGFSLVDGWLQALYDAYGAQISAATIRLFANGFGMSDGTVTSDFQVHPYPSAMQSSVVMQIMKSIITPLANAADYQSTNRANILMHLTASGQKKATYGYNGIPYGGNFIAWCEAGMFAGLRPHTRHVSGSTTLANTDHTIIVNNSSEITITLPSNPEIGQVFEIWHLTNTTLNVRSYPSSSGRSYIYRLTKTSGYDYSCASTAIECMKFVYSDNSYHSSSSEKGMWAMVYYGKNA